MTRRRRRFHKQELTRDRNRRLEQEFLRKCRDNFNAATIRIIKDPDEIERLGTELRQRLERKR